MACHYIPLYNIITYYVTIMTLIAIMAINTLLCHIYDYFQKAKSAFSEQQNAGMGNTPRVSCWRRIPAAWSPRSVNDMDLWFLGSAHGVPNDELCLRWMSMACRESNSFLQWAHLKPNDMGNLFGPSGFPLPAPLAAPRSMLWLDFNLLQISVSGPIDANGSETGTKYNTKRSIRTTLCIAIDGSVDWTCTHHGLYHNLNEKQPKCQKDDLEINESNAIKTTKCNVAHCTPGHTCPKRNARSCSMQIIRQLPKICRNWKSGRRIVVHCRNYWRGNGFSTSTDGAPAASAYVGWW